MGKIIDDLVRVHESERKLEIEKALTLQKAFESKDVDTIFKAQSYYHNFMQRQQPVKQDGMKSLVIDPFEVTHSMGYYGKNAQISFEALRAMSRAPIPRACINTRKDQIAEFCKPQPDKYSKGYIITRKGITDDSDLTDGDKRKIDSLIKFLENCGDDDNKWDLDDFETWARKIMDDSLSMDALVSEIIPTRSFEPTQFVAVDASTFRLAASYDNDNNTEGKKKVKGYYPSYVQVYQSQPIAEFYPWELMWGIRNPSTSIRQMGYGSSELEYMISIVTAMLNADKYNGQFFTKGSAPKGMLMIKKSAGLNGDRLAEFKTQWNAQLSGLSGAHKTPILDAESFEWIDMHKNNRDMEFSKYQEYLIKLCCALYKISPEEIGFTLEGGGGNKMGNDSGKAEKDYSISKGLKPLLTFLQNLINKYIIGPKTNGLYEFKFAGIEAESAEAEEERLIKAATIYLSPDDIRKGKGLKPLPNGLGRLPLNPIIAQMTMANQQSDMESKGKEGEEEKTNKENSNPFLDDESSPFEKAFNDFIQKELIAA